MMCFDHLQPSLTLGLRPRRQVGLHGIYFRPMLDGSLYAAAWKDRPEMVWRRLLLKGSLRNPNLLTLFCLDRSSIRLIKELTSRVDVIALPDPVKEYDQRRDPAVIRRELGADSSRVMLLLFGELSRRKGTFQLLKSLSLLSAQDARRLAVVIAGPIPKADKAIVDSLTMRLKAASAVQLIVVDRFVSDGGIQDLFRASDLVIAPYQEHIGMSAILVRAAVAGRPIIGPSYGLLGELIRSERLGVTVDASSPEAIARAIGLCLSQPAGRLFDRGSAKAFAEFNRVANFTATIFGRLLDGSESGSVALEA
jgi:glycosyltransferase involved in cell wall biosynthesis